MVEPITFAFAADNSKARTAE